MSTRGFFVHDGPDGQLGREWNLDGETDKAVQRAWYNALSDSWKRELLRTVPDFVRRIHLNAVRCRDKRLRQIRVLRQKNPSDGCGATYFSDEFTSADNDRLVQLIMECKAVHGLSRETIMAETAP